MESNRYIESSRNQTVLFIGKIVLLFLCWIVYYIQVLTRLELRSKNIQIT